MNYLDKLQKKCKLDNDFINKINFLLDKLVEFGYIDNIDLARITKKLYNNVNTVFIGSDSPYDYKSGYYDAIKKELYIKDTNNLEALFLRLIYVITTTPNGKNKYSVGYSKTFLSQISYKQEHKYFGLNRAVSSNLVCRLLYTEPTTLSIVPSYRTYKSDFLGNGIVTDNNIYFLEGQILKQMCFALGVEEEDFYSHIFSRPSLYLDKILKKVKIENPEKLLELLDETSLNYSNYNKLLYLDKLLKDNYLNAKKIDLDEEKIELLNREANEINYQISKTIYEIKPELEDSDDDFDVVANLNETLNDLENTLIGNVSDIQNILVNTLISSKDEYVPVVYVAKQKELQQMLIFKSDKLENNIFETIAYKVLNSFENTSSNLIEKIKYSIVSEILSSEKYIKLYKNMEFNTLINFSSNEYEKIVVLSIDGTFIELLKVFKLNLDFKELKDNVDIIKIDNLKMLLNSQISSFETHNIERIYTYLRNNIDEYKNLNMDNVYITNIENKSIVIIIKDNSYDLLQMDIVNDRIFCNKINLSEKYEIFNINNTIYENKRYKSQIIDKE